MPKLWLVLAGVALVTAAFGLLQLYRGGKVEHVVYKETPQTDLRLAVHLPREAGRGRTAVLFFFGGAWITGSHEQFRWQAQQLAAHNVVAIRVDYRVASRHDTLPDSAVEDARDALAWLGRHANRLGVDPERVVVSGGSAGGHLAACLALDCLPAPTRAGAPRPAALVLFNPVLDLEAAAPRYGFSRGELDLLDALGRDRTRTLSPAAHWARLSSPALIMMGDRDPLLAPTTRLLDRPGGTSPPVSLYLATGENHGFFNREPWRSASLGQMLDFLWQRKLLDAPPEDSGVPAVSFRRYVP